MITLHTPSITAFLTDLIEAATGIPSLRCGCGFASRCGRVFDAHGCVGERAEVAAA